MQVVSSIVGALKGLVVLNLGVVSNFTELRQNFHKGPSQWWNHCISEQGASNITGCGELGHIFRAWCHVGRLGNGSGLGLELGAGQG